MAVSSVLVCDVVDVAVSSVLRMSMHHHRLCGMVVEMKTLRAYYRTMQIRAGHRWMRLNQVVVMRSSQLVVMEAFQSGSYSPSPYCFLWHRGTSLIGMTSVVMALVVMTLVVMMLVPNLC